MKKSRSIIKVLVIVAIIVSILVKCSEHGEEQSTGISEDDLSATVSSMVEEKLKTPDTLLEPSTSSSSEQEATKKPESASEHEPSTPETVRQETTKQESTTSQDETTSQAFPNDENSTASNVSASDEGIRGQIYNSEDSYILNVTSTDYPLKFFSSYPEAFANDHYLIRSGRFVTIVLEDSSNIKSIKSAVSFFNSETNDFFDTQNSVEFERFDSAPQCFITFRIPDSPYSSGYSTDSTNVKITFSITTQNGQTYFFCCSY